MMAFRQTDLPLPVEPATSRCGSAAMSMLTGRPTTSLPSTTDRGSRFWLPVSFEHLPQTDHAGGRDWESRCPRRPCREWAPPCGWSGRAWPGPGRRVRCTIWLTRMPGPGWYSKVVTTGPGRTSLTSPSTPKERRVASSRSADCVQFRGGDAAWVSGPAGVSSSRPGKVTGPDFFFGFLLGFGRCPACAPGPLIPTNSPAGAGQNPFLGRWSVAQVRSSRPRSALGILVRTVHVLCTRRGCSTRHLRPRVRSASPSSAHWADSPAATRLTAADQPAANSGQPAQRRQ